MRFLCDRMKLVVEPSGAVGSPPCWPASSTPPARAVGVVLSGGNVGAARFAELLCA